MNQHNITIEAKLADVAGIQVLHQQQKEKLQFISALSAM